MTTRHSDPIDWPWLAGTGVRVAGIIPVGMLLAAGLDPLLALVGGSVPSTADWASRLASGGRTLLHQTAPATAILYGLLSAGRAG